MDNDTLNTGTEEYGRSMERALDREELRWRGRSKPQEKESKDEPQR